MGDGRTEPFRWMTPRVAAVFLFILGAVLLVLNLSQGSLYPWDEALSAMRAWHMFKDGISLTVSTFGSPDFNKPPLYYWLAAWSYRLFEPGLFALRLPGIVFGFCSFICAYLLAEKVTRSSWAACFALACLVLNPHWLNFARLGKLEAAMAFSLISAVLWACFGKWRHSAAGGILAGLLLSIGAWIKHPFFGAMLLLFFLHWRYCDRAENPWKPFLWGLGTFILVGCGWYFASLLLWGKEFWNFYFAYNVATRVVHGIEGHSEGFFFLVKAAFAYSPVAFLCFIASMPALVAAWRKGDRSVLLAVGLAWLFLLLLCCMTGKRKIYIVGWYPLGAVCAAFGGAWLVSRCRAWLESHPHTVVASGAGRILRNRRILLACMGIACLYAVILTGVTYKITPDHSPQESAVYRAVKQQAGGAPFVMTNVDAPAVLYFELGRMADAWVPLDKADAPFLESAFSRASSGTPVVLVIEEQRKNADAGRALLAAAAATHPGVRVEDIAGQGRFWAVRLASAGKAP